MSFPLAELNILLGGSGKNSGSVPVPKNEQAPKGRLLRARFMPNPSCPDTSEAKRSSQVLAESRTPHRSQELHSAWQTSWTECNILHPVWCQPGPGIRGNRIFWLGSRGL